MDINEKNIIKKCQSGDLEQFGFLYDKYIKKIYNFIYFKTHHKETAEDLTSHVFVKAFEHINDLDFRKGTMQAWLYRIARNAVIDFYRTKKKEDNIEDIWDLSGDDDIERDMDISIRLEKVEKYLKNLKHEQREIIIMRVWQDIPYKDIAEILGKSESSCKMYYSRAIRKLRKEMPLIVFLMLLLKI